MKSFDSTFDGKAILPLLQIAIVLLSFHAGADIVWDGPDMSFTKANSADWTQPANQDRITPGVWLTRADSGGIFNIVSETAYVRFSSPADTAWAFLGLRGNSSNPADITAANFANLTFDAWSPALGGTQNLSGNIVNRPGVAHLISEDIYLDITFTSWSGFNSGGGFSYTRSTEPVPEVPATGMIALGVLALAGAERKFPMFLSVLRGRRLKEQVGGSADLH